MRLFRIAGLMFAMSCVGVATESGEEEGFATVEVDEPIEQALVAAACTQGHALTAKNIVRDFYGQKYDCTWPGFSDHGICANNGFYMELYLRSRFADGFAMVDIEACRAGLDCQPQWNIWRCACIPNPRCERVR